jgi:hypothetical protein
VNLKKQQKLIPERPAVNERVERVNVARLATKADGMAGMDLILRCECIPAISLKLTPYNFALTKLNQSGRQVEVPIWL